MFKRYEVISLLTERKEKGGITRFAAYIPYGFQWLVLDKIGIICYFTWESAVQRHCILVFLWSCIFCSDTYRFGKTVSSVANPDTDVDFCSILLPQRYYLFYNRLW